MPDTELPLYYSARDEVADRFARELFGPGHHQTPSPDELLLTDPPITRYLVGVLWPQSPDLIDEEQDYDLAGEPDDQDEMGHGSRPVDIKNCRYPSNFSLSFSVDTKVTGTIEVEFWAARYEPAPDGIEEPTDEDGTEPDGIEVDHRPRRARRDHLWRRVPLGSGPVDIDVTAPAVNREEIVPGLDLDTRVRKIDADGLASVTVSLINTNKTAERGNRDEISFFQPEVEMRGKGAPCFASRSGRSKELGEDTDLLSYRLLYRHAREFASGHGCSATWVGGQEPTGHAETIRSGFVPQFELELVDSNPGISSDWFSMKRLAEAERPEVCDGLEEFCGQYEGWINSLRERKAGLAEDLADTAAEHIDSCSTALARMRSGVEFLRSDGFAWRSFQLANQAMFDQRCQLAWIEGGTEGDEAPKPDQHFWRPFQLAFILLALRGLADSECEERNILDLLWFPTGGGKTEAYLGLIAFSLFMRRLRDPERAAGVTVIMRYTLRLLTLQQFERAASLICACEALRRVNQAELGRDTISIGLWVGSDSTPNTRRNAQAAKRKLRGGEVLLKGDPVKLQRCPWCGAAMDHNNYWLADKQRKPAFTISCWAKSCEFEKRLPVFLVDEDIYDHRPSLLVATVDKFASLPWKPETGSLFNLDGEGLPPELIIQDELHLITGPLGTLTGLYEVAVDMLCESAEGSRPKVVASTATIRQAEHQVRGLFDREVDQFPPPGLDARDSWFAVELPREEKGSRLYLGAMAPGTSQTTLMVRAYSVLLQSPAQLDTDDSCRDPYWSLVGYFNSLRVLGGAKMQVFDDIPAYMEVIARRLEGEPRPVTKVIELTSREPDAEIPDHLKELDIRLGEGPVLPLDVILATNMISVGVDIDRLGLMAVMGQPQSASEYIQATSRVGRRHPGLIAVLFNAARSRDLSHYEGFHGFHSALYREVNPSSVTPFSARARDRGLHAVLVALCRHTVPGLRENKDAGAVAGYAEDLARIRKRILARVRSVKPDEVDECAAHLDQIIQDWTERAARDQGLVYNNPSWEDEDIDAGLLIGAEGSEPEAGRFPTLWSLRDVDTQTNLYSVKG